MKRPFPDTRSGAKTRQRLTPFQRLHLGVGLCLLFVLLVATKAVHAQSLEEAVRANVALATRTCVTAMFSGTPPEMLFTPAGFTYRAVDRGTNDYGVDLGTGHYFDAPADTAKAEVPNIGGPAGLCKVTTTHMKEVPFAALVAAVIFERYPGAQTSGLHQWTVRQGQRLPLIVAVRTVDRHRYEAPGTVEVSMGFPG